MRMQKLFVGGLSAVLVFGVLAVVTPPEALAAKGGKGGPKPPPPPPCGCAEVIEIEPGVFCELEACAEFLPGVYECLYTCPFPLPPG